MRLLSPSRSLSAISERPTRAIVTGAIHLVAIQQRAAAAGIDPGQLQAVVAPVPVQNQQLGLVAGRGPDNEAAAAIMSMLLLVAIMLYGNLVLTGVAEEKSSRVVEVLVAGCQPATCWPARSPASECSGSACTCPRLAAAQPAQPSPG